MKKNLFLVSAMTISTYWPKAEMLNASWMPPGVLKATD